MTSKTMCWGAFFLLVAATCSSGCYRTVATVRIDKSNQFVVTKAESASEDDLPAVVGVGDGQILQIDEKHRVEIKLQGQDVAVDQYAVRGSKTKKVTTKELHAGPGTISLDSESTLVIEVAKGNNHNYLQSDLIDLNIQISQPGRGKLIWGRVLTTTGWVLAASSIVVFAASYGEQIEWFELQISSILFCAVGIPLWVSGGRQIRRSKQKSVTLPEPTAMISPETNTYGLGLRWRL